jgi:hypothetical protein
MDVKSGNTIINGQRLLAEMEKMKPILVLEIKLTGA